MIGQTIGFVDAFARAQQRAKVGDNAYFPGHRILPLGQIARRSQQRFGLVGFPGQDNQLGMLPQKLGTAETVERSA